MARQFRAEEKAQRNDSHVRAKGAEKFVLVLGVGEASVEKTASRVAVRLNVEKGGGREKRRRRRGIKRRRRQQRRRRRSRKRRRRRRS